MTSVINHQILNNQTPLRSRIKILGQSQSNSPLTPLSASVRPNRQPLSPVEMQKDKEAKSPVDLSKAMTDSAKLKNKSPSKESEKRRFQFGVSPKPKNTFFSGLRPAQDSKLTLPRSPSNVASTTETHLNSVDTIPNEHGFMEYSSVGSINRHENSPGLRPVKAEETSSSPYSAMVSTQTNTPMLRAPGQFNELLKMTPQSTNTSMSNPTASESRAANLLFYSEMKKVIGHFSGTTTSAPTKERLSRYARLKEASNLVEDSDSKEASQAECSKQTQQEVQVSTFNSSKRASMQLKLPLDQITSNLPENHVSFFQAIQSRTTREPEPSVKKFVELAPLTNREPFEGRMNMPSNDSPQLNLITIRSSPVSKRERLLPKLKHPSSEALKKVKLDRPPMLVTEEDIKKHAIFQRGGPSDGLFSLNLNNPLVKIAETPLGEPRFMNAETRKNQIRLKKGTHKYSKAVLVKYFDQFETKIIQPEFMQKIGSMCITELWSGNNKLTYLQQMRDGINVYRNRHREGENYESLFRPDRRQYQQKVDDHRRLNTIGVDDTRERELDPDMYTIEKQPIVKYRDSKDPTTTGQKAMQDVKNERKQNSSTLRNDAKTKRAPPQQSILMRPPEIPNNLLDIYLPTKRYDD